MSEENERTEKPTPPPLRDVKDGAIPLGQKRRGRPPKVRPIEPVKLPAGVVKAEDATIAGPSMMVKIDGSKVAEMVREQLERMEQKIELVKDTPLLTLHLRRVGAEITDGSGTVHIPASGAIPDGTPLVAHFYRED
ncbi:MAG: hypothetical protein WC565_09705 [Parcubacteria group bacterium]|jgi:hypothetical protein